MLLRILSFLMVLSMGGCAAMEKSYEATTCNANAGYEKGVNDATAGHPMNSMYFSPCPDATKEATLKGYRDGYQTGLGSRPTSVQQVQVNIQNADSARPFFCEIKNFEKSHFAFGATLLEAQKEVERKCMKEDKSGFSCTNPQCKENR